MTIHMEDEPRDPTQWPPPPEPTHHKSGVTPKQDKHRLLSGAVWTDVLFGCLVSFVSLTALTLVLFNPLAARILPKAWSSEFRLLSGWALAVGVQAVSFITLRQRRYIAFTNSMIWTAVPTALTMLCLIVLALLIGS